MSSDEEFGCIACGAMPAKKDKYDLYFCNDCFARRELLIQGGKYGWPALNTQLFADDNYGDETWNVAIAEGQLAWLNAATFGKDEYVIALLGAIVEYEKKAA